MSEEKFTKGEWKVGGGDDGLWIEANPLDNVIADIVPREYPGVPVEEDFANAKLLAAAPDLLRACRKAIDLYAHGVGAMASAPETENSKRNTDEARVVYKEIQAAIEKATKV